MKFDGDIILGIFLLILAVSGNFIAESLSCKTRKLLTENMLAKNVVIFLIVYFSLGLVSDPGIPPYVHLIHSGIIWLIFLIFNKMTQFFTGLVFFLLFACLVCHHWVEYYKANGEKNNKEIIEKLQEVYKVLAITSMISTVVGFSLYFRKQYTEHYKEFNLLTFMLGKLECDSSK